jgi:hypothetical protein
MNTEKISVRATESGQTLEVVVLSKRVHQIEVVLGEGVHSVKCALTPTRNGVQADIDRLNPTMREYRRR